MNRIYKLFTSIRLALVLIMLIALLAVVSTFVPQGLDPKAYSALFPSAAATFIGLLGLGSVFRSVIFLSLLGLFTLNLLLCTVKRVHRELHCRRKRDFGPDLVHIGLIVLIVGGSISAETRRETVFFMTEGDRVEIAGEFTLELERFEFQRYPDGRPKEWISRVTVHRDGAMTVETHDIEVNEPLSIAGTGVYQASYAQRPLLTVRKPDGSGTVIAPGDAIQADGDIYTLTGSIPEADPPVMLFERRRNDEPAERKRIRVGESLGPFELEEVAFEQYTGLRAVKDRGYAPVLTGFGLLIAGLFVTYTHKLRESTS